MRRASAAVIDQRQALAFRVLERNRRPAIDDRDIADRHGGLLQPCVPPFQGCLAVNAKAGAGNGVVAALLARSRKIEEGDVAAGRGHAVGIEQVIGGNIVLVDGPASPEAQAQQLRV